MITQDEDRQALVGQIDALLAADKTGNVSHRIPGLAKQMLARAGDYLQHEVPDRYEAGRLAGMEQAAVIAEGHDFAQYADKAIIPDWAKRQIAKDIRRAAKEGS